MEHFIISYGYPALMAGSIIEGEAALIGAGLASHIHLINGSLSILICIFFPLLSDTFFFILGKTKGKKVVEKIPFLNNKLNYVVSVMSTHAPKAVFLSRFAYGFRNVLPAYFGFSGISYKKFIFYDFLGAIVWALTFFSVGYFSGALLKIFVDRRHLKFYAIFIIFAVAVLYWFGLIIVNRLKVKKELKK